MPLIPGGGRMRHRAPGATLPGGDLSLYGGGDADFGLLTLRHQRYNDSATMTADINGTNPTGSTTWDAAEEAVKISLPDGKGTLDAQLRFGWNDGGADRLEVFLQVRHGSDWANYASSGAMPNHKSLQLAVAGSPSVEQRFTTRDRFWSTAQGDGSICYVDVRDVVSVGEQPKGPADALKTPVGADYDAFHRKRGLWYLYQWAIDYGADSRAYSLSLTEESGSAVKIYDQQDLPNWDTDPSINLINHINEFWVEYNSSEGDQFIGPGTIHVKDLRVYY